jgi:type VI secretion system protein ImpG
MNDPIYRLWETERQALEDFYARLQQWKHDGSFLPMVPLSQAEPWQQGLYQAVAFFSARTRLATDKNVNSMWERLLSEHAAPLLRPMSTMGLLQVQPRAGSLPESVLVPRGTELQVRRPGARVAMFRTEWDLWLSGLTVQKPTGLGQDRRGQRYLDVFLQLSGQLKKDQPIRLHLRVRDDSLRSLQVLDALRRSVREARLVSTHGAPISSCTVTLGAELPSTARADTQDHPLLQIRSFFHQTERELFLNVVPEDDLSPPGAVLRLVLDGTTLPVDVEGLLNRQAVELLANVVPISNLHRMQVQLPIYDGTRDQLPVLHPLSDREFAPYELLGVYERSGPMLTPLPRGVLPPDSADPEAQGTAGTRGYDAVYQLDPSGSPRVLLDVQLPEAWQKPVALVADVLWYQPWLQDELQPGAAREPSSLTHFGIVAERPTPFTVEMVTRYVRDAKLTIVGNLQPNRDNALRAQSGELWRLAELRSREQLSLGDVRTLLRALGVLSYSPYRTLPARLQGLSGQRVAQVTPGGIQARLRYELQLTQVEAWEAPLLAGFLGQLRRLLDAYSPDPVTLDVIVGGERWEAPADWP